MPYFLPLKSTSQYADFAVANVLTAVSDDGYDITSRLSFKVKDEKFEIPFAVLDEYTSVIVREVIEKMFNHLPNMDNDVKDKLIADVQMYFGLNIE